MSDTKQYIPGVCNIGRTEVRKRRRVGILALLATAAIWGLMEWQQVSPGWRLLLFVPASMAATGLLQSALGFCAAFGLSGVFKFGTDADKTDTVQEAEFRKKDANRAWLILTISTLIGIVVAGLAYKF